MLEAEYDAPWIRGPVVLKIAGAPLIQLPNGQLKPRSQSTVATFGTRTRTLPSGRRSPPLQTPADAKAWQNPMPLAVGDYDHMQFLMIDLAATASAGLIDQDHKSPMEGAELPMDPDAIPSYNWLAIGVSDEEWNARMQLFYYRTRKGAGGSGFFAALFEDENRARDQLLAVCGIAPLKRDSRSAERSHPPAGLATNLKSSLRE